MHLSFRALRGIPSEAIVIIIIIIMIIILIIIINIITIYKQI